MDILEEISARYDGFSKTRKRICDYILSEPEQCCFCSLRSFAQRVHATEVTVLNFCRALGLKSYLELKKALQDYVIQKVNPGKRMKLAVAGSDSAGELYGKVARAEREAIQTTFERNTTEQLFAFAELLHKAGRVYIAAHDLSRVIGDYLHYRLNDLGIDSYVLDLQDKRDIFNHLAQTPERSLLVAVAIPPYGADTVAAARYCGEIGIPVVALTDRPGSPVAQDAAAILYCHVSLLGLTNSFTAMMSMVDTVSLFCSYVAGEGEEAAQTDLRERFEAFFPAN
ncbi:MAG: MurR/RpiR family transcriptional regulator [Oscillospiraceae bacterium]|nr:MurR/RpiR family transcriptional regulator [Oscillospiraceae bacterium]